MTTSTQLLEAQRALYLDQPHQEEPVKLGALNGRRVAALAVLGITTGIAGIITIATAIFASPLFFAALALTALSFTAVMIVKDIDLSRTLLNLIKQLVDKIKDLFEKNQELTQQLEEQKLLANPEINDTIPVVEKSQDLLDDSAKDLEPLEQPKNDDSFKVAQENSEKAEQILILANQIHEGIELDKEKIQDFRKTNRKSESRTCSFN